MKSSIAKVSLNGMCHMRDSILTFGTGQVMAFKKN